MEDSGKPPNHLAILMLAGGFCVIMIDTERNEVFNSAAGGVEYII